MASVRVTFAWTLCKQPALCEERIARASLGSHHARLAGVFTRAACRTLSAPCHAEKEGRCRPITLHTATKPPTQSRGQCLPALSRISRLFLGIAVDAWVFRVAWKRQVRRRGRRVMLPHQYHVY